MTSQTETRRTDWHEFGHYGYSHYRIWQEFNGREWFQRHEWKLDRWNDGALDALRGKAKVSADADYLEGYREGSRMAQVRVVMPRRPEGYYHMPVGTFD